MKTVMRSPTPASTAATPPRPTGQRGEARAFKAEMDITELDDRRRASLTWPGRGVEISGSQLVFRSRRMCYAGRSLCFAVHLVDDRPVPLFGEVASSEYDGDGLYKTVLSLLPLPEDESIKVWLAGVSGHSPRT